MAPTAEGTSAPEQHHWPGLLARLTTTVGPGLLHHRATKPELIQEAGQAEELGKDMRTSPQARSRRATPLTLPRTFSTLLGLSQS